MCSQEGSRRHYLKNKERLKQYREANKEKIRLQRKKYRDAKKERDKQEGKITKFKKRPSRRKIVIKPVSEGEFLDKIIIY